jgi:hypothetical protein
MPVRFLARRWGLCIFFVGLFLTQSIFAQVEVSRLRTELVWQRSSPAKGATEGPVLYQLVLGSGTPGTIAKFDTNPRHLINSDITDNGGIVAIGAMSVDSATGIITFAGGQTFPGTGSGTVTSITGGTGLTGGTISSSGTLALDTTYTDGRYLKLSGGTLTGALNGTSAAFSSTVSAGNVVSTQLSSSTGQALTVNAGNGSGSGGALTVQAGSAGVSSGGAGGNLTLQAGNAMAAGGSGYGGLGAAGMVSMKAGDGYNNVGGDVMITSGANGPWTLAGNSFSKVFIQGGTINPGDGAAIKVEGGHNTVYGSPPQYASGGNLSLSAGSGTCSGGGCGSNTSQAGGNVSITAGNGGAGSTGGSITLSPGTGTSNGNVQVAGNLNVTGTLSKGAGSFKIDHPLDPANKYLSHSFVESPDMMNIYNGNVVLDGKGQAWVELPDYFEALNQDFRYQLTAIGAPGPNLYVAQEIKSNRFQIAGGKAGGKVSWQVTGVRHDAYANAHRIPTEEEKIGDDRGSYLHPELFNQTEAKRIIIPRQMPREKAVVSAQSAQ